MTDKLNEELRADLKKLPEVELEHDAGNVHIDLDIKPATESIQVKATIKL
jgi:hypothetical protein